MVDNKPNWQLPHEKPSKFNAFAEKAVNDGKAAKAKASKFIKNYKEKKHQAALRKIEIAKARKEAGLTPKRSLLTSTVGTGTKAINYHRQRRLAKLEYRNKREELIGTLQDQKQQNKLNRPQPPGIRPLGDKQFSVNPSKRLNAGIRKVKGTNPLSDKGINKRINLNKSNGGFFNKRM